MGCLPNQVNLRYGVLSPNSRTGTELDTCTACAGTMILEFAALSRLTQETVFEVSDLEWGKMNRIWFPSYYGDPGEPLQVLCTGTTVPLHRPCWPLVHLNVSKGCDTPKEVDTTLLAHPPRCYCSLSLCVVWIGLDTFSRVPFPCLAAILSASGRAELVLLCQLIVDRILPESALQFPSSRVSQRQNGYNGRLIAASLSI